MRNLMLSASAVFFAATLAASAQDAATAFVEPGAELTVGEKAVVPFVVPNGPIVPVEFSVTAIEEGTLEDIAGFQIPPELADARPIFVYYEYTNLSDEDLSNMVPAGLTAIDDRNIEHLKVSYRGNTIEKCTRLENSDLARGETGKGCDMYMIHKDGGIAAALYKGSPREKDGVDARPIYQNPVRWVPGEATAATEGEAASGTISAN